MAEINDPEKLDSLIEKSKHGGKREGAGRRPGSKGKKTIEKEVAKKAVEQRVLKSVDKLINSQINLATGEQYLFWQHYEGGDSKGKRVTELITDPKIIKQYIDGELDTTDGDFYYISTKPANNQALQGLFDRVLGKAPQGVEMLGEQKIIIETRRGSDK